MRNRTDDWLPVRCRDLQPHPSWQTPWATIVETHVTARRELSDIAAPFGIKLAFEFIGFGGFSVRTLRGAWAIIQQTGRDNVSLVIDVAQFHSGGGLLSEIDALDPRFIYAFHLDDLEDCAKEAVTDGVRLLPRLGVAPIAEVCARRQAIGYDGPCAIELFRPEYWA